ncbi:uroporphyrinogen-III C-methyltransferase [Endozoicomonas sp. (ex Bugula neritina AB1)]|nr:uroporphyrinogen-III C-methyltransferase [Endozoicomonas sp. (ex Bugula neritina AB1)]
MDYLPLFFDLKNQSVLLIGGGQVALRKARLLSRAGAKLHVVSKTVCDELAQLVDQQMGCLVYGEYQATQLQNVKLVIAATDDEELNKRVHKDATAINVPVNVVDNPALCTFIVPAIVDRSPIVIGVSSGGLSPVLARLTRAKLESILPQRYANLGKLAGQFRDKVKARFTNVNQRRKFWEAVLEGPVAEKVYAGQDGDAARLLQKQLDESNSASAGEVYLVGAGPGDPELLTFKALRLMQQADIVFYDRLVSKEVLDLVRRDAELVYVGKSRDLHAVPQEQINQLLVDNALKGRRVLRLKGGDPFIFGRGGEELEEIAAHNIPFQVVPGITSASACASYAGIPLTHRDYAQSVKFVTGQLKNQTSNLDFEELAKPHQTVVFYMGLANIKSLADKLVEHGRSADTPVAIISNGTRIDQSVLTSTLSDIAELQQKTQLPSPSLIIVGEVVQLADKLAWFGKDILSSELKRSA